MRDPALPRRRAPFCDRRGAWAHLLRLRAYSGDDPTIAKRSQFETVRDESDLELPGKLAELSREPPIDFKVADRWGIALEAWSGVVDSMGDSD